MELTADEREELSEEEIAILEEDDDDQDADAGGTVDAGLGADDEPEAARADQPAATPFLPSVDPLAVTDARMAFERAQRQYDEGEIDNIALDAARRNYDRAVLKSEFIHEMNTGHRNSLWEAAQADFFSGNPDYKSNSPLNAAYVATVNRLMTTEKGAAMSDHELLQEAKRQVEDAIGTAHNDTDDDTIDATQGDNALFDRLDALDGVDLEDALGRLTDDQLQAYEEYLSEM